jgi:hypothetical protein
MFKLNGVEELNDWCSSPDTVHVFKYGKVRFTGHVNA